MGVQIAGLDVGWGQQIDMQYDPDTHRYVLTRSLPPGRYPYKFIMDGRWTYSADHPTFTVRQKPHSVPFLLNVTFEDAVRKVPMSDLILATIGKCRQTLSAWVGAFTCFCNVIRTRSVGFHHCPGCF